MPEDRKSAFGKASWSSGSVRRALYSRTHVLTTISIAFVAEAKRFALAPPNQIASVSVKSEFVRRGRIFGRTSLACRRDSPPFVQLESVFGVLRLLRRDLTLLGRRVPVRDGRAVPPVHARVGAQVRSTVSVRRIRSTPEKRRILEETIGKQLQWDLWGERMTSRRTKSSIGESCIVTQPVIYTRSVPNYESNRKGDCAYLELKRTRARLLRCIDICLLNICPARPRRCRVPAGTRDARVRNASRDNYLSTSYVRFRLTDLQQKRSEQSLWRERLLSTLWPLPIYILMGWVASPHRPTPTYNR